MAPVALCPRAGGAAEAETAIRRFVESARDPILLEAGEPPFSLTPSSYSLEWRGSRLTIQAWNDVRSLARRIGGIAAEKPGKLELLVAKLGGQQGRLSLLDRARGSGAEERHSERLVFREAFRRSLQRQFAGWRIAELTTEINLEQSLSPAYPRAFLRKGGCGWAAIAAPPETGAAAGALTFGLIWLDHLRARERRVTIEGLALVLPQAEARRVCLRLPFLNPNAARFVVFVYGPNGYEDRLDPADYGNLDTSVEPCSAGTGLPLPVERWVDQLDRLPFVERVRRGDGAVSLRVRGLEFARASADGLIFGLASRSAGSDANLPEIEELARQIARMRPPSSGAGQNSSVRRLQPEAWLESQVRRHIEHIEPSVHADPIYGQVPAVAGGDRGVLDLLAAGRDSRLAVIELKASEDIHLPLQALDYWMRVRWHVENGDFTRCGYFPGVALSAEWPRLLLVAPALCYHPKTETILRYFDPRIEVERIGLGAEWRQNPKVMFRIRGARRPI